MTPNGPDGLPNGATTAEHRTAEHRTAEHRTAEHRAGESRPTGEHAAARQTPHGSPSTRPGKTIGLRLFGVALLDPHGGGAPLAAGTDLVVFRDVGAVVAASAYTAAPLTPHDLETYTATVSEVFARHAIVPAPPGTVFRTREGLLGWLELHYYTLAEALDFVAERVVARVTVRRGDPDAATAAATVLPPPTLRLTLDDPDHGVASDLVSLAADAFRDLRREAVALIVLRAGPDAAAPDDTAHGSFLIDRSRWETFEEAVALQGRRHGALRLECSGPWPAYDFVQMQFTT
jgi:hypothetical protein